VAALRWIAPIVQDCGFESWRTLVLACLEHENFQGPRYTVVIALSEPVPGTGRGELQDQVDLALNELELIRMDYKDLLNHSICTYCGNPNLDHVALKAAIIKKLSELGITTDGDHPKALVTMTYPLKEEPLL
jgi:hypothetical protein